MLYKKKILQELGLAVFIENWFRPLLFTWTYKKSLKKIIYKSCASCNSEFELNGLNLHYKDSLLKENTVRYLAWKVVAKLLLFLK